MQNDSDFVPVEYSEEEMQFRTKIIKEMEDARNIRNQAHVEFDDMTYLEFYEFNAKAGNSYLRPKSNSQDVRTTTGTTLEKKNTLISNILNLNLEPTIQAYDKTNRFINELGDTMLNLVKKTYEIEDPRLEVKDLFILNELFDQGTVFVEDSVSQFRIPNKTVKEFDFTDLQKVKWEERLATVTTTMTTTLLSGPNVYLGNFNEPHITKQPYIITRKVLHRSEAYSKYGEWERWKSVPVSLESKYEDIAVPYNDWTLEEYEQDYVEELKYYNKWDNNYMIMLNGVMMFPVKKINGRFSTIPLSSINGVSEYPIAKGILEPIENCAYGRSIPAKTKVDQALLDEFLRLAVLKTRQSYQPPMANNTGVAITAKAFYAASIIDDIAPDKLQPILPATGVTQSEFNMINYVKSIIDQKSVSPTFQGQQSQGNQTATEISIQQRQSMMSLGLSVFGVVSLKKDMTKLRIYNIIHNWATENNVIEMDTELEGGREGKEIVEFNNNIPEPEQIDAEEKLIKALRGINAKKTVISPKALKTMGLSWKIDIVPTPKETTELRRAQFEDSVIKAIQVFAPNGKVPDLDYLGERWAILQGEDPDRYWKAPEQMPQQMLPQLAQGPQGSAPQVPTAKLAPPQLPGPSVNTLQSQ